ncbi:GDSL esterase/lipase At4g01130 [Linum perenne]
MSDSSRCEFEAIFNFGDSNSDTGGFWAAFPAQSAPFGMTYFKKPAGRASDGRLIVDFLGITIPPLHFPLYFFIHKRSQDRDMIRSVT